MNSFGKALIIGAITAFASVGANAAVTFTGFSDSDSGNFDIPTTMPSLLDPNVLEIGILPDFEADSTAGVAPGVDSAFDTLSVTITADPGEFITTVDFFEMGSYDVDAGFALATGSVTATTVLGTDVNSLASVTAGDGTSGIWGLGTSFDYTGLGITSVVVTVSNSLLAAGADAFIEKLEAEITVGTSPIPLPPSALLFLPALAGLFTISRRKEA